MAPQIKKAVEDAVNHIEKECAVTAFFYFLRKVRDSSNLLEQKAYFRFVKEEFDNWKELGPIDPDLEALVEQIEENLGLDYPVNF